MTYSDPHLIRVRTAGSICYFVRHTKVPPPTSSSARRRPSIRSCVRGCSRSTTAPSPRATIRSRSRPIANIRCFGSRARTRTASKSSTMNSSEQLVEEDSDGNRYEERRPSHVRQDVVSPRREGLRAFTYRIWYMARLANPAATTNARLNILTTTYGHPRSDVQALRPPANRTIRPRTGSIRPPPSSPANQNTTSGGSRSALMPLEQVDDDDHLS